MKLLILLSRNPDVGEGLASKVQVPLHVFADDWFLMVASNVVPLDTVAVKVVEHS